MTHLSLTLSADRPMTRRFSELPLEHGFKFYGIEENGKRHRSVLKIIDGVCEIYSSKAGANRKYIGWQPYK